MKARLLSVALVSLWVGGATFAVAQEPDPAMQEQFQEYMQKYAAPGEHHQHLEMLAGSWTTRFQFWPVPGAPRMESTGRAEHKMVLGGRYLQTSYQGEFMGEPFAGMGVVAYDRYQKKYIETWVDTMSTMVMISEGTCDGTGKVRTITAEFDDPMTKNRTTVRSVYRIHDADHYTLEMYGQTPAGDEFKMVEIAHTRALRGTK